MARKHWTQRSQERRPTGKAIDDSSSGTWQRGYAGAGAWRVSDSGIGGGYRFLGFTDPKTGIRRGIYNGTEEYKEELIRLGYTRVKFNASIKKANTKRDYKFNQYTMKQGHIFNRPVYRVTSKKKK